MEELEFKWSTEQINDVLRKFEARAEAQGMKKGKARTLAQYNFVIGAVSAVDTLYNRTVNSTIPPIWLFGMFRGEYLKPITTITN